VRHSSTNYSLVLQGPRVPTAKSDKLLQQLASSVENKGSIHGPSFAIRQKSQMVVSRSQDVSRVLPVSTIRHLNFTFDQWGSLLKSCNPMRLPMLCQKVSPPSLTKPLYPLFLWQESSHPNRRQELSHLDRRQESSHPKHTVHYVGQSPSQRSCPLVALDRRNNQPLN
jgi:hypothetical protein